LVFHLFAACISILHSKMFEQLSSFDLIAIIHWF